jgi:hypothetical protein
MPPGSRWKESFRLEGIIQTVTAAVNKWMHDPESRDDITIVLARRN